MKVALQLAAIILVASRAVASGYNYGADEYVTISNGISPDGALAITAHGGGTFGTTDFHLYVFDAATGKKIATLGEIADVQDTKASAFAAKWAKDSSELMIIYPVDRHKPLKAMSYKLTNGLATPKTKSPVDVKDATLETFWREYCFDPEPTQKRFGTPSGLN